MLGNRFLFSQFSFWLSEKITKPFFAPKTTFVVPLKTEEINFMMSLKFKVTKHQRKRYYFAVHNLIRISEPIYSSCILTAVHEKAPLTVTGPRQCQGVNGSLILGQYNLPLIAFTGRAKVLPKIKGTQPFISVSVCLINMS